MKQDFSFNIIQVSQHELYEWKCGLNESACNSKQNWNHVECQCECKELDVWGFSKNGYMWNHITSDCECNKTCKIDKYLDIKRWFRRHLFGKLVLVCEDQILNAAKTLLNHKKVTCK